MFAPAKQGEVRNKETRTEALAIQALWLLLDPQTEVDLCSDFSSTWQRLPPGRWEWKSLQRVLGCLQDKWQPREYITELIR